MTNQVLTGLQYFKKQMVAFNVCWNNEAKEENELNFLLYLLGL